MPRHFRFASLTLPFSRRFFIDNSCGSVELRPWRSEVSLPWESRLLGGTAWFWLMSCHPGVVIGLDK